MISARNLKVSTKSETQSFSFKKSLSYPRQYKVQYKGSSALWQVIKGKMIDYTCGGASIPFSLR